VENPGGGGGTQQRDRSKELANKSESVTIVANTIPNASIDFIAEDYNVVEDPHYRTLKKEVLDKGLGRLEIIGSAIQKDAVSEAHRESSVNRSSALPGTLKQVVDGNTQGIPSLYRSINLDQDIRLLVDNKGETIVDTLQS